MSGETGAASRNWLMERGLFKAWNRITIRYNDLDPLGHVNNTGMAIFLEEARCNLITPLLKTHGKHLDLVLATTTMDYRRELHYPGEVEVGTICARVGNRSFSLAHGVFQNGECAGTAELTLVFFDLEGRQGIVPPADVRALLESLAI